VVPPTPKENNIIRRRARKKEKNSDKGPALTLRRSTNPTQLATSSP